MYRIAASDSNKRCTFFIEQK